MLAHILTWWEESARIIRGILDSLVFTWESQDIDTFNEELINRFSGWSDDDLFKHDQTVRFALLELTAKLPKEAFPNEDIEGWLGGDVVGHYDEHAMPA